jgi:hypothetical protein
VGTSLKFALPNLINIASLPLLPLFIPLTPLEPEPTYTILMRPCACERVRAAFESQCRPCSESVYARTIMKPMRPLTMVLHHDESEASTETVSRSSTFVLCRTQRRQCVELRAVSRPSHHNHMYFHEHERWENQYMKFRVWHAHCGQRPDDRRNKMTLVRRSNTDDRMQRRRMPTAGARSTGHEIMADTRR